jgi:outer membrane protein assembly factor BamD
MIYMFARYYMRRKAYVAAINRAKTLYTSYPESIHIEEALTIQYIGYKELGLKQLEESTKKVIDHNFPEATITKNFEKSKAQWWEFWKSLIN